MASIALDPNGTRRLLIVTPAGRKTIRLGKLSAKDANTVLVHAERLNAAIVTQSAAPVSTLDWLNGISDTLHKRIARAGLCTPRDTAAKLQAVTVEAMHTAYVTRRTDVKAGTRLVMQQAQRHAVAFYGAGRAIDTINVGDAKDFRRHLAGKYSEPYVAKMIRVCRAVWRDAVERNLVPASPFTSVRAGSSRNAERQRYIDRATIERCIEAAADPQWKLLIALSRYAGLRCPSEHLALTWADIDWEKNRMLVRSSKTEHHEGKASRIVPIFPELRPHLQAVFDQAADGELYVITRYRERNCNLRTQFMRIITHAGLNPWPKLFHNLRASCQTDLADRFPGHVVCQWIGNSEAVAKDHYLMVREEHFAEAAGEEDAAVKAAQKAAQQAAEMGGEQRRGAPENAPLSPENAKTPEYSGVFNGPE